MNKTIIGIYGRANEGKSDTIKRACAEFLASHPLAVASISPIDYSVDILLTIQIGDIKIGIESMGDPNSRMISDDTIKKLADLTFDPILGGCDIILCATRTEGMTVSKVDEIANLYDYHTLWMSSFWSPSLNNNALNQQAALSVVEIINALISGAL